MLLSERKV